MATTLVEVVAGRMESLVDIGVIFSFCIGLLLYFLVLFVRGENDGKFGRLELLQLY